jgi:hypothetical protein
MLVKHILARFAGGGIELTWPSFDRCLCKRQRRRICGVAITLRHADIPEPLESFNERFIQDVDTSCDRDVPACTAP